LNLQIEPHDPSLINQRVLKKSAALLLKTIKTILKQLISVNKNNVINTLIIDKKGNIKI